MTNGINYKTCSKCGSFVDKSNIFNIKNNEICKTCIEKKLEENQSFSPIATFVCSLIPGVGHIFLGKKEKGLLLLNFFLITIFSIILSIVFIMYLKLYYYSFFNFLMFAICGLLIFLNTILYFYSIGNANFSRKYIENNSYLDDIVDKLVYKLSSNKKNKYLQQDIIDKRFQ